MRASDNPIAEAQARLDRVRESAAQHAKDDAQNIQYAQAALARAHAAAITSRPRAPWGVAELEGAASRLAASIAFGTNDVTRLDLEVCWHAVTEKLERLSGGGASSADS